MRPLPRYQDSELTRQSLAVKWHEKFFQSRLMRPIIESCREDEYGDCHWPHKTDKWVLTNEGAEGRHDTGERACNRKDKPLAESLQCHTGMKSKHQDAEQVVEPLPLY